MRTRLRGTDAGFSLVELVVVIGIMGIIITAGFAALYAVTKSQQVSDGQAATAKAFGDPLEQVSGVVMQSMGLASTDPYRIEVWMDRDLDANPEKSIFYVDTNRCLIWDMTEYQPNRTTVMSHRVWTMSNNCVNRVTGEPLFRYYDKNGDEITDMQRAPSDTYSVKATIGVESATGLEQFDSRQIMIRNKS